MLRVGALLVSGVLIQALVLPEFRVLGATPDLVLVIVLAIAFREEPEFAAVSGFVGGILIDLFLRTPLGVSAIVYALASYAVAVLHTGILRPTRGLVPLIGFFGGLSVGAAYLVLSSLAGYEGLLTMGTAQVLLVASLLDGAIALVVFPLVGKALGEDRTAVTA